MKHIHYFIPYLFIEEAEPTKIINKLLRKATQHKLGLSSENQLMKFFGIDCPEIISTAALSAIADNLPGAEDYWLRADPVELKADLAAVYLLGNKHLILAEHELRELKEELIPLLSDLQIKLYMAAPLRWYLQLPKPAKITTYPVNKVIGKNISEFFPTGIDAPIWQRLVTEIQMQLHQSEINKQRQLTHQAQINSVWIWGGGLLPENNGVQLKAVYTDDLLTQGLCQYFSVPFNELPNTYQDENFREQGEYLICDKRLQITYEQGDIVQWQQINAEISVNWFSKLAIAIKNHSIDKISIYPGNGSIYSVEKSSWFSRLYRQFR